MGLLQYSKGRPKEFGVYACRYETRAGCGWYEDHFMLWLDNKWSYIGSDSNFRGNPETVNWVGPLQRKM